MQRWSVVAFGPPALEALGAAIDAAKADDPLAPVTVAVPSMYAGLAARRALAAQGVEERPCKTQGLVNCRFMPLAGIADLLGGPALASAGLLPLSNAVRAEAIRNALGTAHGPLASAGRHPRTLRSLESTLVALRRLPDRELGRLAGTSARAADIVALYQSTREGLQGWYDEHDLFLAAAASVRAATPRLNDVGHVVLYLPHRLTAAELDLCAVLGHMNLLSAVVGATGDAQADQWTWRLADRLTNLLGAGTHTAPATPLSADCLISAPDPEEEVRVAIREIMTRLRRDGLPLHRTAILHTTPSPYAVIAAEELAAAGIPFNGPSAQTLAQTIAGRCLRELLDLAGGDLERRSVMAWLSGSPILEQPDGGLVPAVIWEQLARRAGIVRGDWSAPLKRLAAEAETAEHSARLGAFVDELTIRLDTDGLRTWRGLGQWASTLLDRYLEPASWTPQERDGFCRVRAVIGGLTALDTVAVDAVDFDAFRQAVNRDLEVPVSHHGQFSTGVFVGGVADALGTDFDAVIVLGMMAGVAPPVDAGDPLLPELHRDRQADDRRSYLAALAAARRERVLTFSRCDPRAGQARQPSHWILETAARHAARPVYVEDLATLEAPWHRRVPSFAAGLAANEPANPRDWDLGSLVGWTGDLARHPLVAEDPALARGIAAQQARMGDDFSVWDGHVGPHPFLAVRNGSPVSSAALQGYAVCGMRYLLERVLRVERTDEPEETIEVSPLDRGALIHEVLDRFARGEAPLAVLVAQECDHRTVTAARLWAAEQERLGSLLARFEEEDERLRAALRIVQCGTGVPFDVAVTLPDGGSVVLKGRIDRLDRALDGSAAVAIDYKIGRSEPYRQALGQDPVAGGQLLTLPTYGLAARAKLGAVSIRAAYWFLGDLDEFELLTLDLDDAVQSRFVEALAVIVDGIEAGQFPARYGALATSSLQSCDRCPYDLVCPADRVRTWERKQQAPELAQYVALMDPRVRATVGQSPKSGYSGV
jgi:ATP-dependent helicase/nuclease subunit B